MSNKAISFPHVRAKGISFRASRYALPEQFVEDYGLWIIDDAGELWFKISQDAQTKTYAPVEPREVPGKDRGH